MKQESRDVGIFLTTKHGGNQILYMVIPEKDYSEEYIVYLIENDEVIKDLANSEVFTTQLNIVQL